MVTLVPDTVIVAVRAEVVLLAAADKVMVALFEPDAVPIIVSHV